MILSPLHIVTMAFHEMILLLSFFTLPAQGSPETSSAHGIERRDPLDAIPYFMGFGIGIPLLIIVLCCGCCIAAHRKARRTGDAGWPPRARPNRIAPWNQRASDNADIHMKAAAGQRKVTVQPTGHSEGYTKGTDIVISPPEPAASR